MNKVVKEVLKVTIKTDLKLVSYSGSQFRIRKSNVKLESLKAIVRLLIGVPFERGQQIYRRLQDLCQFSRKE